ncbi:TetR/AcrR family transcriptional regulator [Gordonia sp. MP11Mi]|uniref:Tetracyclin repressor-like C-terminal group 31 domain-containing protein n=1 Tax=Gordonia sp. MP11Mi TaxID=3022769 RepID=A0AA97CW42_9ACTN
MVEPRSTIRRRLIAESAIALIAHDGMRALTHRAVDAAAGIPSGSTSSYARTRSALLEIVVDELERRALRDAGDLDSVTAPSRLGGSVPDEGGELSLDEAVAAICTLIGTLADRRDDMRARYALILELDDADLRSRLMDRGAVHERSVDIATDLLRRAGLPSSRADVEVLVELTDALVLHRTIADRESPWTAAIVTAQLRGRDKSDGSG